MSPLVGSHVRRLEDPRLIQGYTVPKADDLLAFELDRTVTPTPQPAWGQGSGAAARSARRPPS
jgi:hypothetical protein